VCSLIGWGGVYSFRIEEKKGIVLVDGGWMMMKTNDLNRTWHLLFLLKKSGKFRL